MLQDFSVLTQIKLVYNFFVLTDLKENFLLTSTDVYANNFVFNYYFGNMYWTAYALA